MKNRKMRFIYAHSFYPYRGAFWGVIENILVFVPMAPDGSPEADTPPVPATDVPQDALPYLHRMLGTFNIEAQL